MSISDQLRRAIERSGLSRYRIAQQAGVAESTLSRFANGGASLTLESVDRLAPVLGLRLIAASTKKRK